LSGGVKMSRTVTTARENIEVDIFLACCDIIFPKKFVKYYRVFIFKIDVFVNPARAGLLCALFRYHCGVQLVRTLRVPP
jgi:hypothetical protein